MTTRTRLEIMDDRYRRTEARDIEPGSSREYWPHRKDNYAENNIGEGIYRDEGCNFAPSCLDCPYSECVKTNSIGERLERNARIWRDYKKLVIELPKGVIPALAEKYNLSTRAVHRVIKNAKKGKGYAKKIDPEKRKVDSHTFFTAGIYKKRAPLPPLSVSY